VIKLQTSLGIPVTRLFVCGCWGGGGGGGRVSSPCVENLAVSGREFLVKCAVPL